MKSPKGYRLIWNDEFNGNVLDTTKWLNPANSQCSYRNNEQQIYRADDAYLDGGSNLVLRSQKRTINGCDYTSGAISTRNRFTIGPNSKIEICAQLPQGGQGIWPALWMYPPGQWPPEIDMLECVNDMSKVYMTYHWGAPLDHHSDFNISSPYTDINLVSGYHIYTVEWDVEEIRWYIDDILRKKHTGTDVTGTPMMIYLNTAIGGRWPGNVDDSTIFPQYFYIDYVRVYQKSSSLLASMTIDPSTSAIGQQTTMTIDVTRGVAPFTYMWSGLPNGCVSTNTNAITCSPNKSGRYMISVTIMDSSNSQITIMGTLKVKKK